MKIGIKFLIVILFCFQNALAQENNNAAVLKVLLTKYYTNEKVIVKNRLQLLSLYCNKAPNNEETIEVINKNELLKRNAVEIKKQINNQLVEDWTKEYNEVFSNQNKYLKSKVNNCLSLEEFQKVSKRFNDNNQRLMIVSKPIHFANKYCLVKVAFYRNIEHNSGSFFLFENINGVWTIKEVLNEWST
ncbi:hypothetical protein [Flavobacterium sp.]|uniref:hypothetical protein n=1 Tax=Flavobacterium sp. TaxID=239 RepID=UPI0037510C0D